MFGDEAPQCQYGDRHAARLAKMEHRLSAFPGKFNRLLATARQNLPDGKNHCAVRISRIPFRALDVVRTGRFLQWVSGVYRAVLGPSALRAPAAVRDCTLDGEIQRGTVSASLAARHNFRNRTHRRCLHGRQAGVEAEIAGRMSQGASPGKMIDGHANPAGIPRHPWVIAFGECKTVGEPPRSPCC